MAPTGTVEPASTAAPVAIGAVPGKSSKEKGATPSHATDATPATPATSTDAPADPCATKNFHYSQIGNACHSGGRKAAKEVMKGVVKRAKAAGTDLKCGSCHEDLNTFHLKGNAITDLKQWL